MKKRQLKISRLLTIIKGLSKKIISLFIKEYILFESVPFFSDNTYYVFLNLLKRGYNLKYDFYWWKDSDSYYYCAKSGKYKVIDFHSNRISNKIRAFQVDNKLKCIVCCNRFLQSSNEKQIVFYLSHGIPMKSVKNYYFAPPGIDYCLCTSRNLIKLFSTEFRFNQNSVVPLGFPRNDVFSHKGSMNFRELFGVEYNKVIVWYPTYRQQKGGKITNSKQGIPIVYDERNAEKINSFASEHNIAIVVKPHFSQDLSFINQLKLSNILFIDDDFFIKHKIKSYEFVNGCDALLTDYSSIYFDFTLADKPIGVIWEDIDEYRENPGFAIDLHFYLQGAEKIYNVDDFLLFLSHLVSEEDVLKEERRKVRDYVHIANDGKNSERVANFIIEKAEL